MLEQDEKIRYQRHIMLPVLNEAGQERLKASCVFIVGMGGLGAPVALYLASAGVGELAFIDDDTVALDNLPRQILYRLSDVGKAKVTCADELLSARNPNVKLRAINERLTASHVIEYFSPYDIIIDCSDNLPTRYLVNDACHHLKKTLVSASVFQTEGQVFVTSPDTACYRCLFEMTQGICLNCNDAGVLNTSVGLVALIQAQLVIQNLCGIEPMRRGQLLRVDSVSQTINTYAMTKHDACPLCSGAQTFTSLHDKEKTMTVKIIQYGDVEEICRKQNAVLIDVREEGEFSSGCLEGAINRPLSKFETNKNDYKLNETYIIYCRKGRRSQEVCERLKALGYEKIFSIDGGIEACNA